MDQIWIIIGKGGVMMIPLGFCSLLALTVLIERIFALRKAKVLPHGALLVWDTWAVEGADLHHLPEGSNQAAVQAVLSELAHFLPLPISRLEERFGDLSRKVRNRLEQGLVYLDTIAGVAPLLGLLGTALGMIRVFAQLSSTGAAKMEALSSGISEALFTTVAGLCIGIPALIAANLISRQIDNLMLGLEDQLNALLDAHPSCFVEA